MLCVVYWMLDCGCGNLNLFYTAIMLLRRKKLKSIVVKMSGEALGGRDRAYDKEVLQSIADQVRVLREAYAVGVVVGGGNIMRGRDIATDLDISRSAADKIGMLATEQNAIVLQEFLSSVGLEARIASALLGQAFTENYALGRVKKHLRKNRIVVFGGGLGHPYFTTDTTAVQRSLEVGAEMLLMTKHGVDGVYDKDPKEHSDAKRYETVTISEALEKQLGFADAAALSLAREHGLRIKVVNLADLGQALDPSVGTVVEPV